MRPLAFFAFVILATAVTAPANTTLLPGSYTQSSLDIIVLDSASFGRDLNFNLGVLAGNEVSFTVRYANLDAMNSAFGDTVTGGAFSIRYGGTPIAAFADITSGDFAEASVRLDTLHDSLTIELVLEPNSDPIAFYRPWLLVTDTINPGAVADLRVIRSFQRDLVLSWSAPGEDGSTGRASVYEMRYAIVPPESDTLAWWDSATSVSTLPYPGTPGDSESVTIPQLDTSTTYYFLLVSYDELGNRSPYSNIAVGTTGGAVRNYCLYYAGDRYAEVPFNATLNPDSQMTIEAWFYLEDDYTWNHATIIDKPAPTHDMPFYQYNIGPANHTDFYAQVAVNSWYNPFEEYGVVTTDTWIHAAVTFDGNLKKLYLNGVLIETIPEAGTLDNFATDARIGAMGNLEDWFFKGYLDEIRLWNVARTQAQILQNISHHLRGDEQGLAAYWNFNEGEGQVFHDATINDADGYLGNLPDIDERDPIWVPSTAPLDTMETGLGERAALPGGFQMLQNYPNPFNGETLISFNLPRESHVRLEIYDMLGRRIETAIDGLTEAGEHSLVWSGESESGEALSSGIYFYRLIADDFDRTEKMLLLK